MAFEVTAALVKRPDEGGGSRHRTIYTWKSICFTLQLVAII